MVKSRGKKFEKKGGKMARKTSRSNVAHVPASELRQKCVPARYKEASLTLKRVINGEGLKHVLYNSKYRNISVLCALVCKSLKNNALLDHIIEACGLQEKVKDLFLTKILVTELLWGQKRLDENCKPLKIISSYKSELEMAVRKSNLSVNLETVSKPRYARVNTCLTTIKGTLERLIYDEWKLKETPDTYELFLDVAKALQEDEFIQDYHFEGCLVFHPNAKLYKYTLVEKGFLILQDKASLLPPSMLNPPPGSIVLDMCAAPGMKTVHLVNLMQNKGTVYAADYKSERYTTMVRFLENLCGRHNCVQPMQTDSVNLHANQCPGVEYILLDPSCSGSGMMRNEDGRPDSDQLTHSLGKRVENLARIQTRLLVHALTAFPDVKRVVYSTCSTLEEENEEVVQKALALVPAFRVAEPELQKSWEHRGNPKYPFGSKCLVANLEQDKTNGFFVALLERVAPAEPKMETKEKRKSQSAVEIDPDEWQMPKKRKKQNMRK